MNPSTDIPSSMEHGGRLAELHHKPACAKCGHRRDQHYTLRCIVGFGNREWECDCDGYEPMQGDDDVQQSRESVRVDGMGDNPGGGDDAAGADGEQGALGESDAMNGGECYACNDWQLTGAYCMKCGEHLFPPHRCFCGNEVTMRQKFCEKCGRKL